MRRFPQPPAEKAARARWNTPSPHWSIKNDTQKKQTINPDPECLAAFGRAIDAAHICAATLFGEQLVENPAKDASSRALIMAIGMMYFLVRLDPRDVRALGSEGGFGAFSFKPFPPDYVVPTNGPFADFLRRP